MKEILSLLESKGPQTGAQLVEKTRSEVFDLWSQCKKTPGIRFEVAGRRFLRLDRAVPGYCRLSPSIRREFLTYTLLGLENQQEQMSKAAEKLKLARKQISRNKRELAWESMVSVFSSLPERDAITKKLCVLIAGDITYEMSHTVPRPEKSTGEMVCGSDLDIVIIAEDDLPASLLASIDRTMLMRKQFLLIQPNYREEIDYIIKNLARVHEQIRFDTFESMVACKILRESDLLYGSEALFDHIKDLLNSSGIPERLDALERQATAERDAAEACLLGLPAGKSKDESLHLFYTREEGEEIY